MTLGRTGARDHLRRMSILAEMLACLRDLVRSAGVFLGRTQSVCR